MKQPPIFNVPAVVLALLALLATIHGLRQFHTDEGDFLLLREAAFVPVRLTLLFDPAAVEPAFELAGGDTIANADTVSLLLELLGGNSLRPWTLATYALLHADWNHVLLNSLWLLAFGTPVARRIGPPRFGVLCLVTAVGGALAHWATHIYGLAPMIGASGTVSGLMGAALRFAFQDAAREQSRLSLRQVLTQRRTLSFLGVWLLVNLAVGLGGQPFGLSANAIAWEAHIGGLAVGLLLFPLFDSRQGGGPLAPMGEEAHVPPLSSAAETTPEKKGGEHDRSGHSGEQGP